MSFIISPVERTDIETGKSIDTIMGIDPIISRNATSEEIQAIWQVIEDHVYEEDYRSKRYAEYDKVGEQLDNLWHSIDKNGKIDKDSEFYIRNKAVKDKYKKIDNTTE